MEKRSGIRHWTKHTDEYWGRLRRDFTVATYENHGAYCAITTPKPMKNFLEDARKGTAIHMGLEQRSQHLIVKGEREFD